MKNLRRALPPLMLALPLLLVAASAPSPSPPFVRVNPTSGPSGTQVTISGGFFQPRQAVGLYFDSPNSPLGSAVPDDNGNINAPNVPIPDARPGPHSICAAVNVQQAPCAQFQVTAPPPTPQPTPPPTPVPTPSPTDTGSPTPSPTSSPSSISGVSTGSSGGGLLGSLFPWILVPLALLLAAGGLALYLILHNRGAGGGPPPSIRPGPSQPPGQPGIRPGQMTVTHRAPGPGGQGPGGPNPSGPPGGTPPGPPPPPSGRPPSGGWDDPTGPP